MTDTMTRKGVTYSECRTAECRFMHLLVDGRMWAQWAHPSPRPPCNRQNGPNR